MVDATYRYGSVLLIVLGMAFFILFVGLCHEELHYKYILKRGHNLSSLIQGDGFAGGGADVEADQAFHLCVH